MSSAPNSTQGMLLRSGKHLDSPSQPNDLDSLDAKTITNTPDSTWNTTILYNSQKPHRYTIVSGQDQFKECFDWLHTQIRLTGGGDLSVLSSTVRPDHPLPEGIRLRILDQGFIETLDGVESMQHRGLEISRDLYKREQGVNGVESHDELVIVW